MRRERGAVEHYADAAYYDHRYGRRSDDVAFYADLARRSRGPVLELGAGTCRVAAAIAATGREVVALEPNAAMRAGAVARLRRLPPEVAERVDVRPGDVRSFVLRREFATVIAPFNVFMHLYTRGDFRTAMACVHRHLAPGGRFTFDVLVPDPAALARDPSRIYRAGSVKVRGRERLRYGEAFDYDPVRQILTVTMIYEPDDPLAAPVLRTLTQRQYFPEELLALVEASGFEIVSRAGSFEGDAFGPDSEVQILTCRRAITRATRRRSST